MNLTSMELADLLNQQGSIKQINRLGIVVSDTTPRAVMPDSGRICSDISVSGRTLCLTHEHSSAWQLPTQLTLRDINRAARHGHWIVKPSNHNGDVDAYVPCGGGRWRSTTTREEDHTR